MSPAILERVGGARFVRGQRLSRVRSRSVHTVSLAGGHYRHYWQSKTGGPPLYWSEPCSSEPASVESIITFWELV